MAVREKKREERRREEKKGEERREKREERKERREEKRERERKRVCVEMTCLTGGRFATMGARFSSCRSCRELPQFAWSPLLKTGGKRCNSASICSPRVD
jgi:hypothetical protein